MSVPFFGALSKASPSQAGLEKQRGYCSKAWKKLHADFPHPENSAGRPGRDGLRH
jgi:hypothetical protein